MQNVDVEFTIKIDNKMYDSEKFDSGEKLFDIFVLSHIASDYNFIAKSIDKMEEEEKKPYLPYVETLKGIKESILSTVKYELISQEGNIEEMKVTCSFPYYENTVSSLVKTVEVEIFNRHIRSSNFMSTDMVRVINPQTKEEKDILNFLVNVYKHIVKVLEEAKKTIFINGMKLGIEED